MKLFYNLLFSTSKWALFGFILHMSLWPTVHIYNLICTQLGLTMTVSMHYCKLISSSMEWYLSYLFGYGYCAHFFNLYLMIKSLKIWYIWRLHVIGVVNVALTKSHISLLKIDNHVRRDSNINIWYFIV